MNKITLLRVLRQHIKLSEKRNIDLENNKFAKYGVWVIYGFVLIYLMFLAVMLSLIANDIKTMTATEMLFSLSPFILTIDFAFRFISQQTPAQLIKPYLLLPISKYACIDCFILSALLSYGNLTWFFILVPYTIMSVVFSEGIIVSLGFLLGFYILILINSLWYMLVRTLISRSILYWLLPVFVYACILLPWITDDISWLTDKDLKILSLDLYSDIGSMLTSFNILAYLFLFIVFSALVFANRRLQYISIWQELASSKDSNLRTVTKFSFFDKFGEIGEYLKLEVKSIMRNKNIRKTFIYANVAVVLFSLLISFTEIYDSNFMTNFWCVYCFSLYGAMILINIMGYEGNYIDCLMVHKENIISLLKAKYYFYSMLLFLPLLLLLPTVFMGKCTILMLVSYMLFIAGAGYCMFFQLAVINKKTIPLNTKFIGKVNGHDYVKILVEMIVFFVPVTFISILQNMFSDTVAYLILMSIGIIFIFTNKLWIRNIYNRIMLKKYDTIEGFRTSR